jgi:drug/metabolite transporter (DMT)-like permease
LSAWIVDERATVGDWITIVVVLGGVTLFFFDQLAFDHMLGNAVALLAGVVFALNIMLLRLISTRSMTHPDAQRDPLRAIIMGDVIGAVIGAPFCFLAAGPDLRGWGALAALGIVQQTFAYLCYGWAIKRVTALEGLLIPVVEPILSPVWVMLVFGEQPGPWALIGGSIVVGAVTLRALLSLRRSAVR